MARVKTVINGMQQQQQSSHQQQQQQQRPFTVKELHERRANADPNITKKVENLPCEGFVTCATENDKGKPHSYIFFPMSPHPSAPCILYNILAAAIFAMLGDRNAVKDAEAENASNRDWCGGDFAQMNFINSPNFKPPKHHDDDSNAVFACQHCVHNLTQQTKPSSWDKKLIASTIFTSDSFHADDYQNASRQYSSPFWMASNQIIKHILTAHLNISSADADTYLKNNQHHTRPTQDSQHEDPENEDEPEKAASNNSEAEDEEQSIESEDETSNETSNSQAEDEPEKAASNNSDTEAEDEEDEECNSEAEDEPEKAASINNSQAEDEEEDQSNGEEAEDEPEEDQSNSEAEDEPEPEKEEDQSNGDEESNNSEAENHTKEEQVNILTIDPNYPSLLISQDLISQDSVSNTQIITQQEEEEIERSSVAPADAAPFMEGTEVLSPKSQLKRKRSLDGDEDEQKELMDKFNAFQNAHGKKQKTKTESQKVIDSIVQNVIDNSACLSFSACSAESAQ